MTKVHFGTNGDNPKSNSPRKKLVGNSQTSLNLHESSHRRFAKMQQTADQRRKSNRYSSTAIIHDDGKDAQTYNTDEEAADGGSSIECSSIAGVGPKIKRKPGETK